MKHIVSPTQKYNRISIGKQTSPHWVICTLSRYELKFYSNDFHHRLLNIIFNQMLQYKMHSNLSSVDKLPTFD
jgi:hypothetical protein